MTQHYEEHANKIVSAFKDLLPQGTVEAVGDKHFDELSMLIESAISTSVVEELEQAADKIAEAANQLRRHAEAYD